MYNCTLNFKWQNKKTIMNTYFKELYILTALQNQQHICDRQPTVCSALLKNCAQQRP